jgi:hypothetical protein
VHVHVLMPGTPASSSPPARRTVASSASRRKHGLWKPPIFAPARFRDVVTGSERADDEVSPAGAATPCGTAVKQRPITIGLSHGHTITLNRPTIAVTTIPSLERGNLTSTFLERTHAHTHTRTHAHTRAAGKSVGEQTPCLRHLRRRVQEPSMSCLACDRFRLW